MAHPSRTSTIFGLPRNKRGFLALMSVVLVTALVALALVQWLVQP